MGLRTYHGDPPAPEITANLLLGNVSGLLTRAEVGNVGSGQLIFDDPDGTLDIQAQKRLYVNEDLEAAGDVRVWFGYVGTRTFRRRAGKVGEVTGAGREITTTLDDVNRALKMRIFPKSGTGTGPTSANRPSETVGDRLTWLLGTSQMSAVNDGGHGYVDFPTTPTLDAYDYRGYYAVDVLAALAKAVEYNFYAFYCEDDAQIELWFNTPNCDLYTSSLSISNVLADCDFVTVFPPSVEFELSRSPDAVYSGIDASGSKVNVYRQRGATITEFYNTDTSISEPDITSLSELTRRADAILETIASENDRLNGSVELPSSKINDIKAGQRLWVTFSHFGGFEIGEDYSIGHWTRVLSRTVRDLDKPTRLRRVLDLELTPIPETCPEPTPTGYYPPVGGPLSADPGDVQLSKLCPTGYIAYGYPGHTNATRAPDPSYVGTWHFYYWEYPYVSAHNPAGWVDLSGSGAENTIQIFVIGGGTITAYMPNAQSLTGVTYMAQLTHFESGALVVDETQTEIPLGTDATFTVPGLESGFCIHQIILSAFAPSGQGIAFDGFDWVASA